MMIISGSIFGSGSGSFRHSIAREHRVKRTCTIPEFYAFRSELQSK